MSLNCEFDCQFRGKGSPFLSGVNVKCSGPSCAYLEQDKKFFGIPRCPEWEKDSSTCVVADHYENGKSMEDVYSKLREKPVEFFVCSRCNNHSGI